MTEIQAIVITRERCWRYAWVVEFDIKRAFDNLDHDLLMKAVRSQIRTMRAALSYFAAASSKVSRLAAKTSRL